MYNVNYILVIIKSFLINNQFIQGGMEIFMLISANTGLHSLIPGKPRYDMLETMDFLAKCGFEAVDVNFCATIYSGEYNHEPILDGDWKTNMAKLKERITDNGLVVSHTHLPFRYNYDTNAKYYEDPMMLRSIEASSLIGAPYAVCHPLCDENGVTLVDETVETFSDISQKAKQFGTTLAFENMFSTNASQLAEIVDRLECSACWDVGHANLGGHSQAESLRFLKNRIKVLHLHDNYGNADHHNAPYFGKINWAEIVSLLYEINYEGTFNYEVIRYNIPDELYIEHAKYLVKAAQLMLGR